MKFWIYSESVLRGPFTVVELAKQPGFTLNSLVCEQGEGAWQPAGDFSIIRRVVESGDAMVEDLSDPLVRVKIPSKNWREAIIATDTPDLAPRPVRFERPIEAPIPKFSPKKYRMKHLACSLSRQRKHLLLAMVGTLAFGVYYPQMDNIMLIYQGLRTPDQIQGMEFGKRIRSGGAPHAGRPWKRVLSLPSLGLGKAAAAVSAAASVSNAAPAVHSAAADTGQQTSEIASENLGNGWVLKTVVVTHDVNGSKVSETKSFVIPLTQTAHHSHRKK